MESRDGFKVFEFVKTVSELQHYVANLKCLMFS